MISLFAKEPYKREYILQKRPVIFRSLLATHCRSWRRWVMNHLFACHDSLIRVTWLIEIRDVTRLFAWRDSLICVTWLVDIWDMSHSQVWHDSFICETRLILVCDMTHLHLWHVSFISVQHTCRFASGTAHRIWIVISFFSNLHRLFSSLGLFYHVPLKRD